MTNSAEGPGPDILQAENESFLIRHAPLAALAGVVAVLVAACVVWALVENSSSSSAAPAVTASVLPTVAASQSAQTAQPGQTAQPIATPTGGLPLVVITRVPGGPSRHRSVVPNVVGESSGEATDLLAAAGLKTALAGSTSPDASGSVVSESPPAGTHVRAGSTVTLTVGTGVAAATVAVPDLTGLTVAAAEIALSEVGLKPSSSDPGPADATVVKQSPNPGTLVVPGSSVSIQAAAVASSPSDSPSGSDTGSAS